MTRLFLALDRMIGWDSATASLWLEVGVIVLALIAVVWVVWDYHCFRQWQQDRRVQQRITDAAVRQAQRDLAAKIHRSIREAHRLHEGHVTGRHVGRSAETWPR